MSDINQLLQGPIMDIGKAQQDIARLEAEVAHLSRTVEQLSRTVADLSATLHSINITLAEARGGWRTMLIVGGAASALGGAITWVATHIKFSP